MSVGIEILDEVYTGRPHLDNIAWRTARSWSELWSDPPSSQGGRGPKMSLTARILDASVRLRTGQLAAASRCFSCHMRSTDQAAGWCEGHFGVGEADVSLDTMPLERSPCVVNRAPAVREKHTSTAQQRPEGLRGILRAKQPPSRPLWNEPTYDYCSQSD